MKQAGGGPARMRPIKPGDIVGIEQADYCYGLGTLTLRVTEIGVDLARIPALEWVRLRGIEIRWDGTDGNEREVFVRVSALRGQPQ